MKRTAPGLLVYGFRLALRNWPCVAWAYAVNLSFALLTAIPFSAGMARYLDHSLAVRQIAGNLDAAYLGELAILLGRDHTTGLALQNALWLTLLEALVFLFLIAGTLSVYVNGHPPRPSLLLRGGAEFFWRLVRTAAFALIAAGPILAILLAARALLLAQFGGTLPGRKLFLLSAVSGVVVLAAGFTLRLWFDLVEVYVVRNAIVGQRAVRKALRPALRLLISAFVPAFGSVLLAAFAGAAGLLFCFYLWKSLLPANEVLGAFLLSQLGLFLLLAARFWQRGMETVLVLAVDPLPVMTTPAAAPPTAISAMEQAQMQNAAVEARPEPTLQELVQKLQQEPWANAEVVQPRRTDLFPEASKAKEIVRPKASPASLLAEHEKKTPLPRAGEDGATAPNEGKEAAGKETGGKETDGPAGAVEPDPPAEVSPPPNQPGKVEERNVGRSGSSKK